MASRSTFTPGEIFAFLGPNGAGKTTTIQMLTTLLRADERHHHASTGSTRATQPHEVRRRFGIVFQDPEPRRRADRLREHGPARRALPRAAQGCAYERIEQLLKLFELWDRRDGSGQDVLRRHEAAARDRARACCTRRRSCSSTSRRSASIRRAATSSGRT